MPKLELVIFDCDGVLVDSETLTCKIFIENLLHDGLELSLCDFMEEFVGLTMIDVRKKMYDKYGYVLTDQFFHNFHLASLEALAKDLEPIEGIHEVIAGLQVPYCLASNSLPDKIQVMLKKTNLLFKFKDKIFSSNLVVNPKPSPEIYLLAANSHGIIAENCLVIEDSRIGVSAAAAAGMTIFGFAKPSKAKVLLTAGAKITFEQMAELPFLINQHFD